MAYETASSAPRTEDTSGDLQQIATFSENADGSGEQIQAMALTGAEGAKAGVAGLPLYIQGVVLTAIKTAVEAIRTAIEGIVIVDATGQGDVPVTLDSEVVAVDATGQGDVPITLDSEQVDIGDRAARDVGKVDIADVDGFASVAGQKTKVGSFPVTLASDEDVLPVTGTFYPGTQPVSGTFYPATQPISAAALPLPTGAAIAASQQAAATTPIIYNVTMTNPDQEYSQALPANVRRFSLQCLTAFDVRFAFEAGKVATPTAPYALVRAGMNYYEEQLDLAAVTLYVASPDAGKIAEIVCWS